MRSHAASVAAGIEGGDPMATKSAENATAKEVERIIKGEKIPLKGEKGK